jgi:hypothetical protein
MKALISLKTPFLRMPRHARKQESRFEGGRTPPPASTGSLKASLLTSAPTDGEGGRDD